MRAAGTRKTGSLYVSTWPEAPKVRALHRCRARTCVRTRAARYGEPHSAKSQVLGRIRHTLFCGELERRLGTLSERIARAEVYAR